MDLPGYWVLVLASVKTINQLGFVLKQIIYAFAEVEDPVMKIFIAKFDVDNGFWQLDCKEGENGTLYVCYHRKGAQR